GGKLDPEDLRVKPATPLGDVVFGAKTQALAMAAIRETFEETGLLLAAPGDVGPDAGATWAEFRAQGIAPRLDALSGVARAITPAGSPIRFHARFFTASATELDGTLRGSGELEALARSPLCDALKRPGIGVTDSALHDIGQRAAGNARKRVPRSCSRTPRP